MIRLREVHGKSWCKPQMPQPQPRAADVLWAKWPPQKSTNLNRVASHFEWHNTPMEGGGTTLGDEWFVLIVHAPNIDDWASYFELRTSVEPNHGVDGFPLETGSTEWVSTVTFHWVLFENQNAFQAYCNLPMHFSTHVPFSKNRSDSLMFAEGIWEICLVGYMMFSWGYLMMVLGFPWRLQNGDVLACLRGRCACGASVFSARWKSAHWLGQTFFHKLGTILLCIGGYEWYQTSSRVNEMYQADPTSWWLEGPCLHWPSSGHVTLPTCRGCVFFQQLGKTHATHCRSLSFQSMLMFGEFLAQCQFLLFS